MRKSLPEVAICNALFTYYAPFMILLLEVRHYPKRDLKTLEKP